MARRLPRARTLKGDPKLAYYDSGGGAAAEAPIVLVHGATFRSEDWENIFARLATRYRVVAYDARGHGKSGRAARYTADGFAQDLLRILTDVVRAPAIVIGHSLGGATALRAASRRPAAVHGLVLEDPLLSRYGRWRTDYYTALRAALDKASDPAALRQATAKLPLPVPGPRGERTVGEVRGFYSPERLVTYFATLDPAFVDAFLRPDPAGEEELVKAEAKCPALLLVADPRQGSALAEGEAEALQERVAAEVVRFPGVGHRIHGLRPEPFLEALEPFLRRVRALS